MTPAALANLLLRLDAIANAALAAGVLAFRGPLTDAAGLGTAWPLGLVALLLVINAALCWRAASDDGPSPGALRGLAEIDAVFTLAGLGFTLAGPGTQPAWLRAVLIGLAIVVAGVAAAKFLLAQRLAPSGAVLPHP